MAQYQFFQNSYLALRNKLIHNYSELISEIESKEDDLKYIKDKLLIMASARPCDLFPNEDEVLFKIQHEFKDLMEWLDEEIQELGKLRAIDEMVENVVIDSSEKITREEAFQKIVKNED